MSDDDANASGTEGESRSRSSAWTAAPLAVWAFAFVLLRIFAVSGYDWATAFNVSTTLSLSDGVGLLFGSLMGGHILVEALLVILVPLLAADHLWSPRGHRPIVVLPLIVCAVLLVALTVSYASWWLPIAVGGVLGAFALIRMLPRRFPLRRVLGLAMARVGLVGGAGVLIAAAFVQTPWVPLEHIGTTDGEVIGYVMSVDPGFVNVLTEDQEFVILPVDSVLSRE
ncbi:hypothetical protein [Tomitella gaofuii]|uniref:hypothetical protein n=1 Tax=Tomitella gaofuii TaxID=2760083 RepID=UPI0015F9CC2B|nr:hypothetical protein [Tomitella gaofuii]